MFYTLLLKEGIFILFSYYLRRERISMLRVDNISMLRVDNMAMLFMLLLKEDITIFYRYCRNRLYVAFLLTCKI
jgi:hypothetical protein